MLSSSQVADRIILTVCAVLHRKWRKLTLSGYNKSAISRLTTYTREGCFNSAHSLDEGCFDHIYPYHCDGTLTDARVHAP
eukprot:5825279-Amphidinium_carterae.1